MRIGAKKRPFYRVVAVDERNKRNGAYLELLGTYNPLTNPHEIKLKQDRIDDWIKKGAQKSDGFLRIIGEAPQRPSRKPKKEKVEEAPKPAEKPTEEAPEEVVAEQPAALENPAQTETQEPVKSEDSQSKTEEVHPNDETEVKVDDSATEPQSNGEDTSESVQEK